MGIRNTTVRLHDQQLYRNAKLVLHSEHGTKKDMKTILNSLVGWLASRHIEMALPKTLKVLNALLHGKVCITAAATAMAKATTRARATTRNSISSNNGNSPKLVSGKSSRQIAAKTTFNFPERQRKAVFHIFNNFEENALNLSSTTT